MPDKKSSVIASRLGLTPRAVESVINLLDDGATVPFIARYRKEATGNLDEVAIESVRKENTQLLELEKRKEFIIGAIEKAGALTDELKTRIEATDDATALEDIYLPFKPKRGTKAQTARDMGLEPLARIIMAQRTRNIDGDIRRIAAQSGIEPAAAEEGAGHIIAEWISESTSTRNIVRRILNRKGRITVSQDKKKHDEGAEKYADYFDVDESMSRCPSHRFLAIRRGVNEGYLKLKISSDHEEALRTVSARMIKPGCDAEVKEIITYAIDGSLKRLVEPSISNETLAAKKQQADVEAIGYFSDGVRQLLMAPPLGRKRVLAIDPGFRTGCKIVCLDASGRLLHHSVIYPVPPRSDYQGSENEIRKLVAKYKIDAIAIGNGTASKETLAFIRSLKLNDVEVHLVSEQGASIYSASEIARAEFPDEDITVRGAVSIGRRLIDPLAELVKIPPQSIGVGQYQHDVDQKALAEALDFTVESCVNSVGVDVNTASEKLLERVSGIGPALARSIVEFRNQNGPFGRRSDLLKVPRLGNKIYNLCAGFLRVPESPDPLDNSGVHPERYAFVERIAKNEGVELKKLIGNRQLIDSIDFSDYVSADLCAESLDDILRELRSPGRDPRSENQSVAGPLNPELNSIEDLKEGMVLDGIVNNITAFGAFVELGIKENGLIHISKMSTRRINSPADVVKMTQRVKVKVLEVDRGRKRISLSLVL